MCTYISLCIYLCLFGYVVPAYRKNLFPWNGLLEAFSPIQIEYICWTHRQNKNLIYIEVSELLSEMDYFILMESAKNR